MKRRHEPSLGTHSSKTITAQLGLNPRKELTMKQTADGLHPEAQALLWCLVYNRSSSFQDKRPWRQLEQRGFIRRLDTGYGEPERYEVTAQGEAVLPTYAPFLKRNGMSCPPDN